MSYLLSRKNTENRRSPRVVLLPVSPTSTSRGTHVNSKYIDHICRLLQSYRDQPGQRILLDLSTLDSTRPCTHTTNKLVVPKISLSLSLLHDNSSTVSQGWTPSTVRKPRPPRPLAPCTRTSFLPNQRWSGDAVTSSEHHDPTNMSVNAEFCYHTWSFSHMHQVRMSRVISFLLNLVPVFHQLRSASSNTLHMNKHEMTSAQVHDWTQRSTMQHHTQESVTSISKPMTPPRVYQNDMYREHIKAQYYERHTLKQKHITFC